MKSFLISILMFIMVFGSIRFGILDVIDSNVLTVLSAVILIAVILCGIHFIGKPQVKDFKSAFKLNFGKKGSDSDEK